MSVVAAQGFLASATHGGVKTGGQLDMSLVVATRPAVAAAVFTRSLTAAPPVRLSRRRVQSGHAQAVLLNSGCANAGTGEAGLQDAVDVSRSVSDLIPCEPDDVLVCSTGPIGSRLPVAAMSQAIPTLVRGLGNSDRHAVEAATGILTTDSRPKQATRTVGEGVIGGMTKGAGMVRPDMATMLTVITTDLVVDAEMAAATLSAVTEVTFNCLNLDGCQSTNDTVILLASGMSGWQPDRGEFEKTMFDLCQDLGRQMAADAEGASKVVEIRVRGAESPAAGRRLGMAVADSALVRSSFYGADPNWGRILGALGVAGVLIDPDAITIGYQGVEVCRNGTGVDFDADELSRRLEDDFVIEIEVGEGPETISIFTTDLTPDYVRFNGDRS